jgi:RNA polymerase sigma-70 factor, ECF subfamily
MTGDATSLTLLGRLRSGERSAWDRFVHLYRPLILNWCRRWAIDAASVDDVVQDVLTAVFTHLPEYQPRSDDGSFRAWLRGIVRNKLLNWHRAEQKQAHGMGGTAAWAMIQGVPEPNLEETADDITALYTRAADAVKGDFNSQSWEAFWKTTVEGLPAVDVAELLKMTPAAVRMAKSRVLRRIREELGEVVA